MLKPFSLVSLYVFLFTAEVENNNRVEEMEQPLEVSEQLESNSVLLQQNSSEGNDMPYVYGSIIQKWTTQGMCF